jgi:hypothetical protein
MEDVADIQKYLREINPETPAFYAAESIDDLFRDVQETQARHGARFPRGFFESAFVLGFISGMACAYLDMSCQPDEDFAGAAEVFLHLRDREWKMNFDTILYLRASNDRNFVRGFENGKKYVVTIGGFNLFENDPAVAKALEEAESKVDEMERIYSRGLYEQYLSRALYNELLARVIHELHPETRPVLPVLVHS